MRKEKKDGDLLVKIRVPPGLFTSCVAAWWLKHIIKSGCLQIKASLEEPRALFRRSSEHCRTKSRSIQAESLKQFSCWELCERQFCSIRLGAVVTKLPRNELVLDFKKID